jgi:hypothetical protein
MTKKEAIQLARDCAATALDQVGSRECPTLEEAIDSYFLNLGQTIADEPWTTVSAAYNAFLVTLMENEITYRPHGL